jgi:O-methyltransferase
MIKRILKSAVGSLGYRIERNVRNGAVPPTEFPPDFTPQEQELWRSVERYTMTSKERMVSLIRAVQYLERNRIPGAFVECGVWRGGSVMAIAKTLIAAGTSDRHLFLFDTYCGLPNAAHVDVDIGGRSAAELQRRPVPEQIESGILCRCPIEVAQENLSSTGYPRQKLHFVEGRVEDTVPRHAPSRIALLRLDTDWYESTRHELIHLFPRLSSGGILIIDDYGHWHGARLAVDEYFEKTCEPIFLSRIDYTGRIAVRC